MSNMNLELSQIRAARSSLQKFRLKLLRPTLATMESGTADLEIAVDCLTGLEPMLAARRRRLPSLDKALHLEVAELRRELEQVHVLLEGAGNFYQGWSRLLGSATDEGANYTANGKPGAVVSIQPKNAVIHG